MIPLEWYHLQIWGCWYFSHPAILIPACDSSSPAFNMMYSVYKLNNRVTIYSLDFPLSQCLNKWTCYSKSNNQLDLLFQVQFCCFLTCIQLSQETGKVVWYSHVFKKFLQFVWSIQSHKSQAVLNHWWIFWRVHHEGSIVGAFVLHFLRSCFYS